MRETCSYHHQTFLLGSPNGRVIYTYHPHRPRPRLCPSSWSPSLLAPSTCVGVLILFSTDKDPGGSPTACRTTEPRSPLVLSNTPERGWTRRPPTPLLGSRHALYIFRRRWGGPSPILTLFLSCFPGGPRGWSHFGCIRGTPCSTVVTVAPGHSSGGSCGQGCRGYGQTSRPQWTQHPAIILRVLESAPILELLRAGE